MNSPSFSFYPANVKITKPLGKVTIEQFIEANRNPKESVRELFKKIQVADDKERQELKQQLFYFTPCIYTDGLGRSYSNITSFSGLLCLEFDKIPEFAVSLKDWIFDNFEECVCAYISPSGKGTKTLWKIPVVKTVDEFKEYFYGISHRFSRIIGYDPSSQNPSLPLYLSWDENLRYRSYDEAKTWTIRGGKINEFKPFEGTIEVPTDIDIEIKNKIIQKVTNLVNQIDDNAHPRIRNISIIFGGFCSKYGFDIQEAEELICNLIEQNEYMQKNIKGYSKTAKEFIIKGFSSPIEIG